jgi:hypothetical protein
MCRRLYGIDILDILAMCFGGSLKCKEAILNKKDFKYTPQIVKITNYRTKNLQDALINRFLELDGLEALLKFIGRFNHSDY